MRLLIASPVGPLVAEYDPGAVRSLSYWQQGVHPLAGTRDTPAAGDALGKQIVREVTEYFAGRRRNFELPLEPNGTTFQKLVWTALRAIPFGETRTYGAIATQVGRPGGSRAVGQANRRNPLPIVIPCHRVLSAGGGLGGYMGSGAASEVKLWLLRHEGCTKF